MVYATEVTHVEPVENRTIAAVLRRHLDVRADQEAVVDHSGSMTYGELYDAALGLAGALEPFGVTAGTPVLLMLDNHLDFVRGWLGLSLVGALEVPVNTAYRGGILAHVVNDSGARVAVVEGEFLQRLLSIKDEVPQLRHVIVRRPVGDLPAVDGWTLTDLADLPEDSSASPADIRAWDTMGILYTSGTTGNSKGVLASHGLAYSYSAPPWIRGDERIMVNLPLFHIGGQWAGVYAALLAGGTAVIIPRFSASTFWDDVRTFGCTQTLMLGAMASFLAAQPARESDRDHPLRHVNMVPVLPSHQEFSERFDLKIGSAYGLTEFSSPILTPYGSAEPNLAGWLRDDFEARVVDDDDLELPAGRTGELVLRAKEPWAMMSGYHGLPEATQTAWRNLWFHTGDAVSRDEAGRFHFVDRKNDALRVRGENVSSYEVEVEIAHYEGILACAVVAVPSEHSEDDIKAVVVPVEGQEIDPASLLRFLAGRLPYFMVPRYYEFLAELPTTPTQKIKKAELRAAGITDRTWDRERAGFRVTRFGLEQVAAS